MGRMLFIITDETEEKLRRFIGGRKQGALSSVVEQALVEYIEKHKATAGSPAQA